MVTQNYTISTVKTATPPKVKMSQYDYGMRTITFAVVDGSGAAVDLTGKTVTVEGTRIDGHAFATTCTVADNVATFIDTVDMTNAAGDHPAELVVRQNDERLGTMNFIISVEPAAMDEDASITEEDQSLFEQLYGVGNAALTAAETLYQHILDNASAPIIYNTASGAVASFSDGADDYPIKGLTVAVDPVQSGSGDPSPSNVRPISGFSEVKVTRAGKNLISIADDAIFEQQRCTAEYGEGSVIATASGTYSRVAYGYTVKKGEQYTVSFRGKSTGNYNRVYIGYNKSNINAYYTYITLTETETQYTYSFTASTEELVVVFYVTTNANSGVMTITDFQVELGSTATDYEPHQGETYTLSLGETVYGGTLDVVKGKMMVDRKYALLNNPTKWLTTEGTINYYYNYSLSDRKLYDTSYQGLICTAFPVADSSTNPYMRWISTVEKRVGIKNRSSVTLTLDDVKTMAQNGQIAVVYELATPIEITLTPTQINTLLGANNVYSDAGAVEVEYPADTKRFILNSIASALA